ADDSPSLDRAALTQAAVTLARESEAHLVQWESVGAFYDFREVTEGDPHRITYSPSDLASWLTTQANLVEEAAIAASGICNLMAEGQDIPVTKVAVKLVAL